MPIVIMVKSLTLKQFPQMKRANMRYVTNEIISQIYSFYTATLTGNTNVAIFDRHCFNAVIFLF